MSYLWAQVIAQSIRDLQNGNITDARDAYSFLFANDEDLKFVCECAGLNHEVVKAKALAFKVPLCVSDPVAVTEEKRSSSVNPKAAAASRRFYAANVDKCRAKMRRYYAANSEQCKAASIAWRERQRVSA